MLLIRSNSRIVVPFDLRYDEEQNAVVLEWEYLGIEPAVRYQFWRSERDGWRGFPWRDLPAPSREANHRADVWEMMPIAHFDIQAGEQHRYSLRTETAEKKPARATVGSVQIPGAILTDDPVFARRRYRDCRLAFGGRCSPSL